MLSLRRHHTTRVYTFDDYERQSGLAVFAITRPTVGTRSFQFSFLSQFARLPAQEVPISCIGASDAVHA